MENGHILYIGIFALLNIVFFIILFLECMQFLYIYLHLQIARRKDSPVYQYRHDRAGLAFNKENG